MSVDLLLSPGFIIIGAAVLLCLPTARWRKIVVGVAPLLALLRLWALPTGSHGTVAVATFNLDLLHVTATGRLFASAFLLAVWLGGMFAAASASRRELISAYVYAGSAISVTLCGDLITLFLFWEAMAVTSAVVIWSARTRAAWSAGMRYLLIHLFGGVILLAGIALWYSTGGSLQLGVLQRPSLGYWLIMAGFLVNTGAPPLSFWIADAYPQASPTGMVFLAAFTTKTAVYVLISYFAGADILIPIGLYMAIYGALYALREDNVRRILAYSIVNQVGFMVAAVGIGGEMAINGATAHAFAHIMYKTVLLMGAGSVMLSTGEQRGSALGGLARRMPWTSACVLIGAAASMGVPLTSSFVTKSLILEAAAEHHLSMVWLTLIICSAAVVFNAGVRFPYLTLFQPQQSEAVEHGHDPDTLSRVAMMLTAAICLLVGLFPGYFYTLLPYPSNYHPYNVAHILEQLQLLLPAALLFFISLPLTTPVGQIQLDTDWLLRRPLLAMWHNGIMRLLALGLRSRDYAVASLVRGYTLLFHYHGPRGILARSWPTGSIALWVALMLVSYVILFTLRSMDMATFIKLYLHG